jgi:hypothetical protein
MDEGPKLQKKLSLPQLSLKQRVPRNRLCSPSEKLSFDLYQTFRPDLPATKNLASFTKRYFVSDLPRHVGLSLACDLSMKALCLAHTALLDSRHYSLIQSHIQYGRALSELQLCLEDPDRARTVGTLCATMLLGLIEVCQRLLVTKILLIIV